MKYKIVAIRDRAADVFGQPNFVAALGVAIRSFGDEVKRAESPVCQHPDDFDLYHLGEFDDSTGTFDGQVPVMIAVGKDYKV